MLTSVHIVLPDSHDFPSLLAQQLIHRVISYDVGIDLSSPKLSTRGRSFEVFWAFMPEASVDENCKACTGKYEIGFAREVLV